MSDKRENVVAGSDPSSAKAAGPKEAEPKSVLVYAPPTLIAKSESGVPFKGEWGNVLKIPHDDPVDARRPPSELTSKVSSNDSIVDSKYRLKALREKKAAKAEAVASVTSRDRKHVFGKPSTKDHISESDKISNRAAKKKEYEERKRAPKKRKEYVAKNRGSSKAVSVASSLASSNDEVHAVAALDKELIEHNELMEEELERYEGMEKEWLEKLEKEKASAAARNDIRMLCRGFEDIRWSCPIVWWKKVVRYLVLNALLYITVLFVSFIYYDVMTVVHGMFYEYQEPFYVHWIEEPHWIHYYIPNSLWWVMKVNFVLSRFIGASGWTPWIVRFFIQHFLFAGIGCLFPMSDNYVIRFVDYLNLPIYNPEYLDRRADHIAVGKLIHNDPLYALLELDQPKPNAWWKGPLLTREQINLTVSLELLAQLCVSNNLALNSNSDLTWERLQRVAASVHSVNLDRYLPIHGKLCVQDTMNTAYAMYQQMILRQSRLPFPRTPLPA